MVLNNERCTHDRRGALTSRFGIAAVIVSCIVLVCAASTHSTAPRAHALAADPGAISISPTSGPAGTTITVSGTGWSDQDGTSVSFGYMGISSCVIDNNASNTTMTGGAFSGWLVLPLSLTAGKYTICAIVGGTSYPAGTFDLLTTSTPAVSITPASLQENQQATITATNYVPSGTMITFYWATMSGTTEETLGSSVSNSVGTALLTFGVPITSLASGSYLIEAAGGGGQPPAYFSSTPFTYTAPVAQPSPTPSPRPSPTATQNPTPTTTVGASPTAGASPTVGASPTAGATPRSAPTHPAGATPTSVTNGGTPTTSSTTTSGNGGSPVISSDQSNNDTMPSLLPVIGIIAALAALIGLVALLLVRRRRIKDERIAQLLPEIPFGFSAYAGQYMPAPSQFTIPGMSQPYSPSGQAVAPVLDIPLMPPMPPMSPEAAGNAAYAAYTPGAYNNNSAQYAGNGPAVQPGQIGQMQLAPTASQQAQAPQEYRSLLAPSTPVPEGPLLRTANDNALALLSADPALDARRREAQAGLYVEPVPPHVFN